MVGRVSTALAAVMLPVAAYTVFRSVRRPSVVAVTSRGVVAAGEELPWERITTVRRGKEGVHVRLSEDGKVRYVTVGAKTVPSPTSGWRR